MYIITAFLFVFADIPFAYIKINAFLVGLKM